MFSGECSQGTLTQSKRHIMACVNLLEKHLLSYCSINLCMWWFILTLSAAGRELQVTSASCPRQPSDSSWSPAVCAGQHCLWQREEDFFHLSYKHHSDNAESFTGSLPHVPKFPLLSPSSPQAQDHTSYLWPCHPECHSPDPGALFPLTSRTSLPPAEGRLDQENLAQNPPPTSPHITVWQGKATFAGLGFCPKQKMLKNPFESWRYQAQKGDKQHLLFIK